MKIQNVIQFSLISGLSEASCMKTKIFTEGPTDILAV